MSQLKSPDEIDAMRRAGAIHAAGIEIMKNAARPGINTIELSELAAVHVKKSGAELAFMGYPGSAGAKPYPAAACISVNDAVVHGIPSESEVLESGDVVSLDLGVKYKEMIVDGATTVTVGQVDERKRDLVETTKKALHAGLKQVKDGCHAGDIGAAIQEVIEAKGYGVIRDLVGHGVGYSIHEDPNIPNFGKKGKGPRLQAGMTVAIEPMATLGDYKVYIDVDRWTVRTRDGSTAAHFEHTVLVTKNGCEILTQVG